MPFTLVRRIRPAAAALLLAAFCSTTASAQYFGRNKVHYKNFDFQILQTEHFDIYFYPSAREGIDISARMAERWHARLEKLLEHTLRGRQPLVLYASHPDFEQTNVIGGQLGESTGGVTESVRRRIVLPLAGSLAETDHVLGHELVHAFQFDITTRPGSAPGETGAHRLPLWFIEGMAEYLSIGAVDPNTTMWLRDAARGEEKLPTIDDLDNPQYFPYRWGQAFWSYVCGKWGDEVLRQMLTIGGASGDPAIAIRRVLGLTTAELSTEWHASIRSTAEPVLAATVPPSEVGRLVLGRERGLGGALNVGPAVSPDGRYVAFLSERSLFSIDVYVADAASGRILQRLTSSATDPHFSSLQFIYSSGGWDAESRRLAVATVVSGRPALAVFDAVNGRKEREIPLPDLDEILNPTWAPDGRQVAFTGLSRGLTDLYVLDLETSALRPLTHDAYSDLQPAWSPDGRRIAFSTDRYSTMLDSLDIGESRLAVFDLESGQIGPVPAFPTGKHMSPQWAPDGGALFFISDRDGISNLYRVTLEGALSRFTNVSTGLTGITGTSPALSVASQSGIAMFSVYEEGNHNIYALDLKTATPREVEEIPTSSLVEGAPPAAVLPPHLRRPSPVSELLADASFGLPPPQDYTEVPYSAKLSLEAIGQPTIAFGADRFGAAIGGGIAFQFSDMLGDQNLMAAVQLNSGFNSNFSFKDTSAQLAYLNQSNRWNWGLLAGQVPYLSGGIQQSIGAINGEPALIEQRVVFRQTDRTVSGLLAYPFNRAHRVEFQGGVSRLSFDQVVDTNAYSLITGQRIFRDSQEEALADPLSLATTSAALVFDTSVFGATSPVQGQRYRFEAAPTFGGVNFTSLLADYRRYDMPVSFYTLASRVMHYGRYGSGGDDRRLSPLFLGYPSLVRGYDLNSFGTEDCVPTSTSDCPLFDRLIGSRVVVGNLEFRFPLLRPFGVSSGMYGPLPIEVALFADGGVAWNEGGSPSFLGGDARGISSAGIAFRLNLFGFAIGEFDFVRPLQRPGRNWVFQFNLSPGF